MIRTIQTRFHIEKTASGDREMVSFWHKGKEKQAVTVAGVKRFQRENAALWEKEVLPDYEAWKGPRPKAPSPSPAAAVKAETVAPKKRGRKAA